MIQGFKKDEVISNICQALIAVGNIEKAATCVVEIFRLRRYVGIALNQMINALKKNTSQLDRFIDTIKASSYTNGIERDRIFHRVSQVLICHNQFEKANNLAKMITDESRGYKDELFSKISSVKFLML